MKKTEKYAQEIRKFNRFYTNLSGLMNQTILGSSYSLAEARILLEIDSASQCTASDLAKVLHIDSGYLSRILLRFTRDKLLTKAKSPVDGRAQLLALTEKGCEVIHKLYDDSTAQACKVLENLTGEEQEKLMKHMGAIRNLLDKPEHKTYIIRSMKYGEAGYIAHRHCVLYEREYGLAGSFEKYVLDSLTKYIDEQPEGEVWVAEENGQIIGFIAIVSTGKNEAQLRWFLLEPEYRGAGLGRQLMKTAIDYCKQKNFCHVFLWTFEELSAARHLYKNFGFTLTEQVANDMWKRNLVEERWDLKF